MIAAVVYPHQLFPDTAWLTGVDRIYLVEDPLFFTQYPFHRQKLMLHRASMRCYGDQLRTLCGSIVHVEAHTLARTEDLAMLMARDGIQSCRAIDPEDFYLRQRLARGCERFRIALELLPDPHFLTSLQDIEAFVENRKTLFFTNFYIQQRKRLSILLDAQAKPVGGKWSFDTENRRRLPADRVPPSMDLIRSDAYAHEAQAYVDKHFAAALGDRLPLIYPSDTQSATEHLEQFVATRLTDFGDFEDAISRHHPFVYHSVLTPMLNIGLLSPRAIIDQVLEEPKPTPLNSLEGFIRQVIGWREYMRLVYRKFGVAQRTRNYWQHSRSIPASFYDASTGIDPVDHAIQTVLRYGYCHHIERLMVLGNFMVLCEFHPDAVYRWFMEMFVDAYDWVMVPNVYGMSQYADGGLITTKPYISGSSYILKMSDFKRGPWCSIWDGLYWRFIAKHRKFFEGNPRMRVMTSQLDRMGDKLTHHQHTADQFLASL